MKYSHIASLIFGILSTPLFAESFYERELKQITEKRDKDLATAAKPINRTYQDGLKNLLIRASNSNDAAIPAIADALKTIAATSETPTAAPSDAIKFKNKWYRLYLEKVTWQEARQKCARLGGILATVPEEQTHVFINKLSEGRNLWLGATDEKVDKEWLWSDGTAMTFTAWDRGQPDNVNQKSYVLIRSGRWHDAKEDDPSIVGYICEWRGK